MIDDRIIEKLKFCLETNKKISFIVGAGLSAESGIPTFRGKDGYWVSGSKNYKAEEIGTLEMFKHEETCHTMFIYQIEGVKYMVVQSDDGELASLKL